MKNKTTFEKVITSVLPDSFPKKEFLGQKLTLETIVEEFNQSGKFHGDYVEGAKRVLYDSSIIKCVNMHEELIEKLIEARNTIVTINNCIVEKGAVRITKAQDSIVEEIDSLLKQAEQK